MRRRRQLAAALVVASTGLVSAGATLPAMAEAATTLYVDNSSADCTDTGVGSQGQPYCSVQAGVDAAKAGQTVSVAYGKGDYDEQVTVHSSGESSKPIVLQGRLGGDRMYPSIGRYIVDATAATSRGLVLDHVHDVTVRDFETVFTVAESVLVKDSSHITLDGNRLWGGGNGSKAVPSGAGTVRVTGASADVVISRNTIGVGNGGGIRIEAGVTGAVVTTNRVRAGRAATGVAVTDAPGTVVTSNTVTTGNATGIALAGASDHAVVENNIVDNDTGFTSPDGSSPIGLAVSAASVTGTKADFNSYSPRPASAAYSWAGATYQQPAEFATATGQGRHDLRERLNFDADSIETVPTATSGSTDSADAGAPGELTTDLYGHPRVDDLEATDAGAGPVGYYDRGAAELQEFRDLSVSTSPDTGPYPLPVTLTAKATQSWADPATTYTFDFGDGSDPLVSKDPVVHHVYRKAGTYYPRIKVQGADPNTLFTGWAYQVTVNEPGDLVPVLKADPDGGDGPLGYAFDLSASSSPWNITDYVLDFGDGSPKESYYRQTKFRHAYAHPGNYTVTATVKDESGRTATAQQAVHAAYGKLGYTPTTPQRILDTRTPDMGGRSRRLGPGQSITVYASSLAPQVHPDALVLNVTAVNPSQSGYLSVYPEGGNRPATSNVNFTARQTVPNLVTVPTGQSDAVTVYNFSGDTDVVVDLMGYYQQGGGSRFGAVAPSRVLDTRKSKAVGPDASTSVQVRGVGGVPADATAVVLNLTSTGSDAGGYLTAYANGTTRPGTSNLNFTAGQTVANQVVVPIGADGKVAVYNHTGHTHVVADVFGYYGPSGSSLFTPVVPTRLVDTRQSSALGQGGVLKVNTGVPAGATGAVLNVTDTASTVPGYLTVWADGASKPGTSNVNFPAGKTVPNHVTTPLGANGAFDVYNFMGRSQVVADLFGYFAK
ncbi:hypothetical protein CFP65_5055 [Kitasatospora sp. MMS16-BH015]|uniref:PKD domain-containing protein n=1 Tax=Kitasatospora sp. MMS16-BH015 TaxID=2018025 RepID=UPI000CA208D2|nr:PKD domain-containing protein [Kitasatospora sp. MMS16-BH015]AUG79768.1 hypothetical protein CFP65_5055 [Kitasatospora sp. MMS16-BH015]